MKIPQGYKQTDIGKIPIEWEVCQLRDFLILLTDFDANGSFADMALNVHTYLGDGYAWYVRATDLEQNTPLSEVKYVDKSSYDFLKKSSLYGGEVLIAKRGDIGKVYLFQNKTQYATLGPNLYLLKLDDSIIPNYLYYYLKNGRGQKSLRDINASTSLGALYKEDVKNIWFLYPPIDEQRRIAEVLSDVDGLIAALDKKIAKKKLIKQAAMQRLFAHNPGNKKSIGEIVAVKKGVMLTSDEFIYGPIPVIAGGRTLAGYHNVANRPARTITISASGASAGFVAFHEYPIFATDCSTISPNSNFNIKYIYYLLQYHQADLYATQTGGAQPHVHPKDIEEIKVSYIDNIKEQQAIATILSDMDAEISDLERKRDKYKLLKNGMMQKLLTGQIRIK